jgi:hypothetical protein
MSHLNPWQSERSQKERGQKERARLHTGPQKCELSATQETESCSNIGTNKRKVAFANKPPIEPDFQTKMWHP